MKFTISWLKDHLDTTATLDEIVAALDSIGLEVEGIEDPAAAMAAFRVAEILEAEPHPDADKLRLCKVRGVDIDGNEADHQVVCGAPNAKAGLKGIFAPVGAYVASMDLTLKRAKIRGVESFGMMVSESEMGFSDDHDGIIELTGDKADYAIGTPIAQVFGLDDPVIEIGITPNRPDCLGVRGIARDLAARGLGTLKADPLAKVTVGDAPKVAIDLKFDDTKPCPVFAGRQVSGVKNGPSPDWLQTRLKAIGLRPISALVDITNYISFDRGRPLHVYDAAKVKGEIHARLAVKGEELLALDGETYKLTGDECVIADASGVIGLGGVMGGEGTGCLEDTQDVILESAYFDPIRTAMTGRVHNILSDARYRFERGVDPAFVEDGLELATQMVLDICGGTAGPVTVAGQEPHRAFVIDFPVSDVKRLTGLALSADRIQEILVALEFGVSGQGAGGDTLKIAVPEWRPDVEGAADLVEEVARIHGLDNITALPLPMDGVPKGAVLTPLQNRVRVARRALAARGAHEAVTFSFMWSGHAKAFGGGNAQTTLVNPISSELDTMRPSILPNLILAAGRNAARGFDDVALFEVGPQYEGDEAKDQRTVACVMRRGQATPRNLHGAARPVDVFDAKADLLAVLALVGGPAAAAQVVADAPSWYHPGRSGTLQLGPKVILGHFGELHPATLKALGVTGPIVAAELYLDAIPTPKKKSRKSKGAVVASQLQPVRRDFAFVMAADVPATKVVRAAAGADKALITDVTPFDLYEGKNVGEGQKSLAIEVTLQPKDQTMTDKEIEAVSQKIIAAVEKAGGGKLRS